MSEYLWIPLSLLPSLIIFFVLIRIFGKRIGDTVQWVNEVRTRLERVESEITQLAASLEAANQDDALGERLTHQLSHINRSIQAEREAFDSRLKEVERQINARENKLNENESRPPQASSSEVTASKSSLFTSPQAKQVLELLGKGESMPDIARKTGLQVGEVDLIRALKFYAGKGGGK